MSHKAVIIGTQGRRMPVAASAILLVFAAAFVPFAVTSQTLPAPLTPQLSACRSSAIELYNLGATTSAGRHEQAVGLRNISHAACAIAGVPGFRIIGLDRQPAAVHYDRQSAKSPSGLSAQTPLMLAPGAFGYFSIASADCHDDAHCATLLAEEVSLPGDNTWLRILAPGVLTERADFALSAIRADQAGTPPEWLPPTVSVEAAGGSLLGFAVALEVPRHLSSGFPAHFTIRNRSAQPQAVDWGQCVLDEQFSNSAGNRTVASQPCPPVMGPVGPEGTLAAGALASMDFFVAGKELPSAPCPNGAWHAVLQLDTSVGSLSFQSFAFSIQDPRCGAPPPASGIRHNR